MTSTDVECTGFFTAETLELARILFKHFSPWLLLRTDNHRLMTFWKFKCRTVVTKSRYERF